MKEKIVIDIGRIMDEVFDAAQSLQDVVHEGFKESAAKGDGIFTWDENLDLYPTYSYPPLNVYLDDDKNLIFEFALAGFDEKNIQLEFSGDHLHFSSNVAEKFKTEKKVKYLKHRLKLKDVKEQKYYVPKEKFAQEKTTATYANGILAVTIPPSKNEEKNDSFKVNIKSE